MGNYYYYSYYSLVTEVKQWVNEVTKVPVRRMRLFHMDRELESTQRLIELYGRDAFEREHEEASINELHSHVSRAFKTLSLQQTELTAQVLSLKEAMSELSLAMPKVEEKDGALEVENLE